MSDLISSMLLRGFQELVAELDGNPEALLHAQGLSGGLAERADCYLPSEQIVGLYEEAAKRLKCPDFGLRISKFQGLEVLGAVSVLMRNVNNLAEAFGALCNYIHTISPAISLELELRHSEGIVRIHFRKADARFFYARQINELAIGNGQLITRSLLGSSLHAVCINFPHKRLGNKLIYREFFGCEVRFEQPSCSADLPIEVLEQSVMGADRDTARLAGEFLSERFGFKSTSTRGHVEYKIQQLLPTGYCDLNNIAEELGMHPRTLQRRLAKEQSGFELLLDGIRRKTATNLLAQPDMPLLQITGLLGYADQSSLNRSCERWFGASPKAYRDLKTRTA